MSSDVRLERDSLGEVEVPADALYGAQTLRAAANRISGVTLQDRPEFLDGLVHVKIAAARANVELGVLAPELASAIVEAGREVLAGRWRDQFPLDLVQGGGGTATNMNVNEVLASRAAELLGAAPGRRYERVHPNDHVNRSQSTNDVYPTALQLAVLTGAASARPGFEQVAETLDWKAEESGALERLGRTCLQDALPVPAAETLRAHAHAVRRTSAALDAAIDPLRAVPLGATAVGTGLGAPAGFPALAVRYLSEETALPLVPSPNPFDALAHLDPLLTVASALRTVMLVLGQLAQDLRLLSSGPAGGFGEIRLPPVQVGSSLMPGKVNPVIPELVLQIGFEIRGACQTIEAAVAAGELELNIMEPVVARAVLAGLHDSGRVAALFAERCLAGLEWDVEAIARNLEGSFAEAVAVATTDGYDAAVRRLPAIRNRGGHQA
jgi:aspartate ammonia-lyase